MKMCKLQPKKFYNIGCWSETQELLTDDWQSEEAEEDHCKHGGL